MKTNLYIARIGVNGSVFYRYINGKDEEAAKCKALSLYSGYVAVLDIKLVEKRDE